MKQIITYLLAAALFISAVGLLSKNNSLKDMSLEKKSYSTVEIAGEKLDVEVANTEEARRNGLSGRESLDNDKGMLFVFGQENVLPSFWMKDMNFAIDIIWIDDDTVVGFVNDAKPQEGVADNNLTLYTPEGNIDQVLEVNSGFVEKHNVSIGDSVKITF